MTETIHSVRVTPSQKIAVERITRHLDTYSIRGNDIWCEGEVVVETDTGRVYHISKRGKVRRQVKVGPDLCGSDMDY
jgi:hypothetical protein